MNKLHLNTFGGIVIDCTRQSRENLTNMTNITNIHLVVMGAAICKNEFCITIECRIQLECKHTERLCYGLLSIVLLRKCVGVRMKTVFFRIDLVRMAQWVSGMPCSTDRWRSIRPPHCLRRTICYQRDCSAAIIL